ncbi:hypothetical protein [Vibrio panuliri]|nr:hypothetical protein [Vibrio panuliri]
MAKDEKETALMHKTNRQLLIALFSAFCLLWLSAINAVQASTQLQLDAPLPDITLVDDTPFPCPKDEPAHSSTKHHAKVEHQNCSSVCVMKLPFEPVQYALQLTPSSIAPIGTDIIGKAVSRIQTLFRPPIEQPLIDSLRA